MLEGIKNVDKDSAVGFFEYGGCRGDYRKQRML